MCFLFYFCLLFYKLFLIITFFRNLPLVCLDVLHNDSSVVQPSCLVAKCAAVGKFQVVALKYMNVPTIKGQEAAVLTVRSIS